MKRLQLHEFRAKIANTPLEQRPLYHILDARLPNDIYSLQWVSEQLTRQEDTINMARAEQERLLEIATRLFEVIKPK